MTEFEKRLKKFNSFYLWLVIGGGALLAASVVSAIYIRVWLGIFMGICACLVYTLLLGDELRRSFGVKYRRVSGGIALSVVAQRGKGEDTAERRIPSRLMWLDVVALEGSENKKDADTRVNTLIIPASVKRIEADAFSGLTSLYHVIYEGTAEEWGELTRQCKLDAVYVEFTNDNA